MEQHTKLPEFLETKEYLVIGEAFYFPDMSNDDYHSGPGHSSSTVRRFMQSEVHALEEEVKDSPALRFGTAAHAYIVEGENAFAKEIACISGSPYTKANKELKADFEERGYTVISADDREKIHAMSRHLIPEADKYLHPDVGEYPSVFEVPHERAIYWYEGDLLLKVKSDVLRHPIKSPYATNEIILVDYKTTQDCSPYGFLQSVKKYQYDIQAAWYKRGFEKAGFKVTDFYFVAQEKTMPFANKIFRVSESDMEVAWNKIKHALPRFEQVLNGEKAKIYNSPDIVDLYVWTKPIGENE